VFQAETGARLDLDRRNPIPDASGTKIRMELRAPTTEQLESAKQMVLDLLDSLSNPAIGMESRFGMPSNVSAYPNTRRPPLTIVSNHYWYHSSVTVSKPPNAYSARPLAVCPIPDPE